MKRTTVVLTDDLVSLLERERRRRGVSTAAVVREALDAYFGERRRPLAIAALGRSAEPHVARDAEEILAREWSYEHLMGVDDPLGGQEHEEQGRDGTATMKRGVGTHSPDPADVPGARDRAREGSERIGDGDLDEQASVGE